MRMRSVDVLIGSWSEISSERICGATVGWAEKPLVVVWRWGELMGAACTPLHLLHKNVLVSMSRHIWRLIAEDLLKSLF